jgi:Na+-translocating ferredoxin:NAD+ oxidoreductase RnfC subunit
MTPDLKKIAYDAGLAGEGGAGFPTHVKLARHVACVILNGAECEPLLRTDRYIMRFHAEAIVKAAKEVTRHVSAARCVLGLKKSYRDEIAAIEAARDRWFPALEVLKLDVFYPAGDEHALVYEAMGKAIPPGGIPLDIDCVVLNVATMQALYEAMDGQPFIDKYVTVTGEVNRPTVLKVPIGTSIADCLREAGGVSVSDCSFVLGGPMMGLVYASSAADSEVVTKTLGGIIALQKDAFLVTYGETDLRHVANRARAACIQCRMCTDLCPRYLLGHPLEPHKIMRIFSMCETPESVLQDETIQNAALCCECGICELIACPMRIHPRMVNVLFKGLLKEANIRNTPLARDVADMREYRKVPSIKSAAAAGVTEWYALDLTECRRYVPNQVRIPLNQSVGVAAVPIVQVGTAVKRGDLIGECPDGSLGTRLHASITGTVQQIDDSIWIAGDTAAAPLEGEI